MSLTEQEHFEKRLFKDFDLVERKCETCGQKDLTLDKYNVEYYCNDCSPLDGSVTVVEPEAEFNEAI